MCRKGLDRHKSLAFPNGGSYNYFNKSDGGELVRQAEEGETFDPIPDLDNANVGKSGNTVYIVECEYFGRLPIGRLLFCWRRTRRI